MIKREDILKTISWTEGDDSSGTSRMALPAFQTEVCIRLFVDGNKEISGRTERIFNDLYSLGNNELQMIKGFLYENYISCCDSINYGFPRRAGESEAEANRREFGVGDREGAYRQSRLKYILIDEDEEELKGHYAQLMFDAEWHSSLCAVVMRDGKIVGYGEDGLYLGRFDARNED
jgi:hypothetical protein